MKKADPMQDELPLSSISSHALFPGRDSLYVWEIARALSCSNQHVIDLCEEGKFPGAINISANGDNGPKHWRIPVSAYDFFLKENQS